MKKQYDVFADYHQFYISDHHVRPGTILNYDDDDMLRRIKVAPFLVAVRVERNIIVPVEIELVHRSPSDKLENWDHVVEASLALDSGLLEIHECTGGSVDILLVPRGTYRVRVYFSRVSTVSNDWRDRSDCYRIVLWKARDAPIKVLKQYVSSTQRQAV